MKMNTLYDLSQVKAHIEGHPLSLLLIKTTNCGVCEAVLSKLEQLLAKYPRIQSAAVTLEKVPSLAAEYLVLTAPTILLFVEGKEVYRQSRFVIFEQLEETLQLWVEQVT